MWAPACAGGAESEGGQRIRSRLCMVSREYDAGLELTNSGIVTCSQTLNAPRPPGAPASSILVCADLSRVKACYIEH